MPSLVIICSFIDSLVACMYVEEPDGPPDACVIWLHGLGADAEDMAGLAGQLRLAVPVRHVCVNAPIRPVTLNQGMPMRAWYDILGMDLTAREDKAGIMQSEAIIDEAIAQQMAEGIDSSRIVLAGFSQGGAMALFAGLQYSKPLAGILALSAYLPLSSACNPVQDKQLPVFIACGAYDTMVLPAWTRLSVEWIRARGYDNIRFGEYPVAHAVSPEELVDLCRWFNTELAPKISGD